MFLEEVEFKNPVQRPDRPKNERLSTSLFRTKDGYLIHAKGSLVAITHGGTTYLYPLANVSHMIAAQK